MGSEIHLPSFQRAFDLTPADITNVSARIMAAFAAGALAGNIAGYCIGERYGRKLCLVAIPFVTLVSVCMQLLATGSMRIMYAARALAGLAIGAGIPVLPAYIAEISPPSIRGRLVGTIDIFAMSAQIPGFWVCYAVQRHISSESHLQWRVPIALQMIPAGLLIVAMSCAIESPRWLLDRKRHGDALKALAWARNLHLEHPNLRWEMREIQRQVEDEDRLSGGSSTAFVARWKELTAKTHRRRLFLILLLKTAHNLCG